MTIYVANLEPPSGSHFCITSQKKMVICNSTAQRHQMRSHHPLQRRHSLARLLLPNCVISFSADTVYFTPARQTVSKHSTQPTPPAPTQFHPLAHTKLCHLLALTQFGPLAPPKLCPSTAHNPPPPARTQFGPPVQPISPQISQLSLTQIAPPNQLTQKIQHLMMNRANEQNQTHCLKANICGIICTGQDSRIGVSLDVSRRTISNHIDTCSQCKQKYGHSKPKAQHLLRDLQGQISSIYSHL